MVYRKRGAFSLPNPFNWPNVGALTAGPIIFAVCTRAIESLSAEPITQRRNGGRIGHAAIHPPRIRLRDPQDHVKADDEKQLSRDHWRAAAFSAALVVSISAMESLSR